jgi:hypothetical protein
MSHTHTTVLTRTAQFSRAVRALDVNGICLEIRHNGHMERQNGLQDFRKWYKL